MPELKKGDTLNCEVCGLTVVVDEECGCAVAEVICCEEPMVNKGPLASKKKAPGAAAKKKTARPTAKKSIAKKKTVKKAARK